MKLLEARASILVGVLPKEAFDYLADFRLHGQWDGHEELQLLETSPGPIGPNYMCHRLGSRNERYSTGLRYTRIVERNIIKTQRITEYLPDYHLTYEDVDPDIPDLRCRITFDLVDEGRGTRIIRTSVPCLTWWMVPLVGLYGVSWPLVLPWRLVKQRRYLHRIKGMLESGARSPVTQAARE